jgi:hypothetical protein
MCHHRHCKQNTIERRPEEAVLLSRYSTTLLGFCRSGGRTAASQWAVPSVLFAHNHTAACYCSQATHTLCKVTTAGDLLSKMHDRRAFALPMTACAHSSMSDGRPRSRWRPSPLLCCSVCSSASPDPLRIALLIQALEPPHLKWQQWVAVEQRPILNHPAKAEAAMTRFKLDLQSACGRAVAISTKMPATGEFSSASVPCLDSW